MKTKKLKSLGFIFILSIIACVLVLMFGVNKSFAEQGSNEQEITGHSFNEQGLNEQCCDAQKLDASLKDNNVYKNESCTNDIIMQNSIYYWIYQYNLTAKVISNDYVEGNVVIPEFINHDGKQYKVVSIEKSAFWSCSGLSTIKIPDGVEIIDEYAFSYCENLTSVQLPKNLKNIADWVFYGCSNLISIDIPDSVNNIGCFAFGDCTNLNSIKLSKNLKIIKSHLFSGCRKLSSIDIPNSVESIGESAFNCCSNLASVQLSNNLKRIELLSFWKCKSLSSINIPESVESIGEKAFAYSGLNKITFFGIRPQIGFNAFGFLVLNLKYNSCFYGWDDKDPRLGGANKIVYNENVILGILTEQDGLRYRFDPYHKSAVVVGFNDEIKADVKIPNSVPIVFNGEQFKVDTISENAFRGCSTLTSIVIPNSVQRIREGVFSSCNKLKSIQLPNNLISIENNAFCNCGSLYSITIPERVKRIGIESFSNTWLHEISFLGNKPEIGENAFLGLTFTLRHFHKASGWDNKDSHLGGANNIVWRTIGIYKLSGCCYVTIREIGVTNVKIELLDKNDNVIDTTLSDEYGCYYFSFDYENVKVRASYHGKEITSPIISMDSAKEFNFYF